MSKLWSYIRAEQKLNSEDTMPIHIYLPPSKSIEVKVQITVDPDGDWCSVYCNYLKKEEPRCILFDYGPLDKLIRDNETHFIRCNECLGKTR